MNIYPYNRKPFYYETDKMGVVHHSNYIRWFEEARLDFMDQAGFTYKDMETLGLLIPVLSVECQYKHFIQFDEEVSITAKIDSFNGVKMKMSYEVYRNSDNVLCSTGTSNHCFVNNDMKIVKLKREFPEIYKFFDSFLEKKEE
jgi:acyl-CoA thioester hydrolase